MTYNHAKYEQKLKNSVPQGKSQPNISATGNESVFNYSRWKQAQKWSSGDEFNFKRLGESIGSEVRTHLDSEDLTLECRFTIPGGKSHLRSDGITNFLAHAIESLTADAAERLIRMLTEKSENADEPDDEPILL